MPNRFECGPIVCPHSDVDFVFQGTNAGIKDAHIQADLIGKNLSITRLRACSIFPTCNP